MRKIKVSVQPTDALATPGDVLVLKYAQAFYGADKAVARRLEASSHQIDTEALTEDGGYLFIPSYSKVKASHILFVGVKPLAYFNYLEIKEFAHRSMAALHVVSKDIATVVMTIHGPGYGLDEAEAFKSQISGLVEAIKDQNCPQNLVEIIVAEPDRDRAERLATILEGILPNGIIHLRPLGDLPSKISGKSTPNSPNNPETEDTVSKPMIFVAMPFDEKGKDVFKYGIEAPVHRAGFLCERVDNSQFFGDILTRIKERIDAASMVIADLTGENANVFLEVGYAWGRKKPTMLIVQDTSSLPFDVRGQRCIKYNSISELEAAIGKELEDLHL